VALFEAVCGAAEDLVAVCVGPVVQDAAEVVPAGALRELDKDGCLSGVALLTCYRLGREEIMNIASKPSEDLSRLSMTGLKSWRINLLGKLGFAATSASMNCPRPPPMSTRVTEAESRGDTARSSATNG
jgi:hypothetical protein